MSGRPIPVLEIFGPTVQGEGRFIGQKTMFVRTAGCDYSCNWCDSAFTWDGSAASEIRLLSAEKVLRELTELGGDSFAHVTLSGGNPALLPQLGELIDLLHGQGMTVALETQGSRYQSWFREVDELTLSPKPPSSGMATDWARLDDIVERLADRQEQTSLKVVVFDEQDLAYAESVYARYPEMTMVVQPGNGELAESDSQRMLAYLVSRYEWLVEAVLRSASLRRVRVLPQLHTWLWGNKRGV
ncbi:7-carboxy-7-deazaguanine synthase QueE [Paenibacillus sp. 598K]|uniref:7-carboxy-7-deazaguanine synthase QueE n=1 Tax=Paenibacillus sp. 598K TaxID=1117987 RepID=UPI000FFA767B|nr:7-carboxy-7-deazaguanine synthase QueE [Paenibacillus sp. 598K]GBF75859.1 7-carboxy-7-deazaguanine synthase QueE [Paenibacillus sp. 598K]